MKENSLKRLKPIFFIGTLIFLVAVITLITVFTATGKAYAYPSWLEEYKVGLTFDETKLQTTKTTGGNDSTVTVKIVCGIPSGVDISVIKVRVRTRNGTAVAGVDYTSFDSIVELRRTGSNQGIYFDSISIKVNKDVQRFIVNGVNPYFTVELYEVLTDAFSIQDSAKSLTVSVGTTSTKLHSFQTSTYDGAHPAMLSGYYDSKLYGASETSNLNIYSVDKAGQTLSASFTLGYNQFSYDYYNTGLATYYIRPFPRLDENGVTMTSWCTLTLYDGNTSGTQLYQIDLRHIYANRLEPQKSYGDMKHENEVSCSGAVNNSEEYGWTTGYIYPLPSGTLYETFKSGSNYWRKTYDWNIYVMVADVTAPTIKGWYVDQATLQKGDKIRISVRFNEPITASDTDLASIKLNTTLSGTGGFNNYKAKFDCVSRSTTTTGKDGSRDNGLVTDTLIFEFDPSAAVDAYGVPLVGTIGNIAVDGFENVNKIHDYGRKATSTVQQNYCKNYNSLTVLESDKCSPRQLRNSLTLSFDNRSPIVEQTEEISSGYVNDFTAKVNVSGSNNMYKLFYLWSTSPDINYSKVSSPSNDEIGSYYEIIDNEMRKTTDFEIVPEKTYFVYKKIDISKVYEYERNIKTVIGAANLRFYEETLSYHKMSSFKVETASGTEFTTTLSGVSGTYFLHVLAKSTYSDETSTSRRFGPIYVDNSAPYFSDIEIDGDVREKDIKVNVSELSGIQNISLYLCDDYFEYATENSDLVELSVLERKDDGTFADPNGLESKLENGVLSIRISAYIHLGFRNEEGAKSFGDYYVGFKGTDVIGNVSEIYSTDYTVNFDMRDLFAPFVKIDGVTVTDESDDRLPIKDNITFYAENAYVVDISSGPKNIVIGRPGPSDPVGGYYLHSAYKIENNARIPLRVYEDNSIGQLDVIYFKNYVINDNNGVSPTISFDATTTGYYEISTFVKYGSDSFYSTTQKFYVTDGNQNSVTKNYDSIFNVGVNFKNKLFALGTSRYYSRTGTGLGSSVSSYYNDSELPVVFSSRDVAIDYVTAMEFKDFYAIRVTDADVLEFNNGVWTVERGTTKRPEKGEVWIRYKATTWNFSTAQRDWSYYYYGDTSSSIVIDVDKISGSLRSVVDKVVNIIIQNGSDLYLNSATASSESGALYVDPVRLPPTLTVTKSAGNPSTELTYSGSGNNPLAYEFDKDVFYDKYNDRDDITLISAYRFNYLNTTKLYYAPAKFDPDTKEILLSIDDYKNDFKLLTTPYLPQSVSTSGSYIIRELDESGMRDYSVYVDKDTPSIVTQYADIDEGKTMHYNVWLNQESNDTVIHTTEFTIQLIEDKAFSSDVSYNDYHGFGIDADTYTYIAIFNVTKGERTFETGFSLKDLAAVDSAYELPYGVFEIEVYDRAGNGFSFTVSRAEKPLTTEIQIIKDDNIKYIVPDRIPTEIESVYVTRPGKAPEEVSFIDNAELMKDSNGIDQYGLMYTDAGRYEFTITDKYGYTMSPSTDPDAGKMHSIGELIRVNPYENIKWVTRTDDGRFVDLDVANISMFRADSYYLTSDEKLSFILDSTTIYSYTFTGNVTYNPIERTIDGKKYVYVNVDSSERWSVKIYYTLYPELAVTYNRIAKKAVVPAAIELRAQDRDSKGVAQADENNRIVVYVGTQDEIIDPIVVNLRTRDRSAIASLGDYDAFEGSVTLTPSNKEQMVVIDTHPSGFSTYNSVTYEYANRTFDLFIDSIEGNAEKSKSSIECACPGAMELNITVKDGIKVFDAYLSGSKHGLSNVVFDKLYSSSKTNRYYDRNEDFSISPTWLSTYINTGLASAYVTARATLSGDDISDYSYLRFTLSDTSVNSQLFRVYVKNVTDNNDKIVFGYSYDELKTSNESYSKETSVVMDEARGEAQVGRYFLVPVGSKGNLSVNLYEEECMYITYASAGQGGTYPIYNYVVPGRSINDPVAHAVLIDSKAPTVQSWHIDHNTIRVGETLRLSVRFSEPVYISGKDPVVTANVTGGLTNIDFKYAGGAGTDTLYFEFDPSKYAGEVLLDSISIASVTHFGSICDYAYNTSKRNNFASSAPDLPRNTEWDPSCSLDTRTPVIDLDTNYYMPLGPQRTASVPIAVSKTTQGAKMEYSWTVESDAPAMYEKSLILTSSSQKLTLETSGLSGTYYLHVYMKSVYGKVSTKTFGPFYFDNLIPSISGLYVEEATKALKERNVLFFVNDEPRGIASSGVAQIYLYYLFRGESEPVFKLLYDVNQDEQKNVITIPENGRVTFLLDYEDLGMKKEEQKDVTMALYAVDGLGNSPNISAYTFCPTVVNFDARSEVEVSMTCSKPEFFNADGTPVYNVLGGDPRFTFAFSRQADEYDIRELYIAGKQISTSRFADYLDYTADTTGIQLTFKKNVVGHVRINFKAISGTDVNQSVQESSDVSFYLTEGANAAETKNYLATQSGTLFINKVYMLDTSVFYYHNGEGVRQLNYNDTSRFMAFSSRDKAVEYVKYYEMQDLGILQVVSPSMAASLNTGDGSYRKAADDSSVIASVGQIWIRYKRSTWDNATTPDSWVYYYYGSSSEIDPERLPNTLSAAIAQVTDTIVDRGGYVYLTSADDNLDKNGSPYLDKKQIVTDRLTTFVTLMGNEMKSAVSFSGDPDIYNSKVSTSGGEICSLVTTYQFEYGDYTKIFYTNQVNGEGNPIEKEYKLLPKGTVFGSLNIDGGVYWLRECDENGVRDYIVYLDKTAPTVNVVYENAKGDSVERELDGTVDGMTVNGKTLRIKGFSTTSTEIDTMSYIALFKKNGVLVSVYRAEDIPGAGVEVAEGQYFLEIADRSGNIYRVNVSMNSTPMEVKITVEENRHIRMTCNRDATEIKNFEIYLDGKLLESNYSASLTYYQSGVYSFRVEDWFGNTFTYDYELKRELPKINWFYEENEVYVQYDGTQSCLKIQKTAEREYQIITNKILMFSFDTSADYTYEFSDKSVPVTAREFNGFARIRINELVDWTVTVRYARYPDIYVVYNCLVDVTAPIINVTARQDVVKYFDQQQLEQRNRDALTADSPEYFTPDNIYFQISKTVAKGVRNNSTVYSPLLTLQFTDKSICNQVEIYLDGIMIREFLENEGVNNVTIDRFGEYRIVARDTLGNQSEFTFINKISDDAYFYADGKELSYRLSPADSIVLDDDDNYAYPPDAYLYDRLEMLYDGSATIVVSVNKNGEKRYVRFESINGALYEVSYRLVRAIDEAGEEMYDDNGDEVYVYQQIYSSTIIADFNLAEVNNDYVLATADKLGVDLLIRFDQEKHAYYRVLAPKDGEATVEMRVTYNNEYQPYFVKAVMCGELPSITIERTGEEDEVRRITPTSTEEAIYVNGEFYIIETDFKNITEVKIAYSETTDFKDYQTVYTTNDGYTKLVFENEGFYRIIAKNIYGREAVYNLIMSNELRVLVTATYLDGASNQYLASARNAYYANESIAVDVYFEQISYIVTYNGVKGVTEYLRDTSGVCSLIFKDYGEYHLSVRDEFGNVVEFDFEIKDRPFEFKKDYLVGYNQDALRLEDGFSNKKLSVDAQKMIADDILQVTVVLGSEEFIVYDLLNSTPVEVDEQRLSEAIGRFGDGDYILRMRNGYGNVREEYLHYRGTTTLSVSRFTRTSTDAEPIAISQGELIKVYSNYNVIFQSVAGLYDIRLDGSRVDLPLTVAYPTDGDEAGEYVRTVTYIDEYGFEYEFEVNLIRKTLEIDLKDFMNVVTINDVVMTQDDVMIRFENSVGCEVSLNGGEREPYVSGKSLTKDGTYRFYITDIAGNVFTTTVKKDTLVEFTFLNGVNEKVVENGGVVNEGSARFMPVNKDTAKIDLAVLNGEEFDMSTSVGFSLNGKWEFIVSDDIGNKAYYYFYVITNSISRFEYDSPYSYKISSVQYDGGDGVLISYTNQVIQNENNNKMIFTDSGTYIVVVSSMATAAQFSFELTIDKTPPTAKLVGVENGGSTIENVTLTECHVGEVVRIYKNGNLEQTVTVTSETMKLPEIKEKGDYKIVITNTAGNEQVFEFTRRYTANVATTVTIILACLLVSIGLFVVLILRKRLKV